MRLTNRVVLTREFLCPFRSFIDFFFIALHFDYFAGLFDEKRIEDLGTALAKMTTAEKFTEVSFGLNIRRNFSASFPLVSC